MTYFAKSDNDSPVPKPSDQMAPTVTLPNASEVAESGGTAPPSPYDQTDAAIQASATQMSSAGLGPQRGMYDPNGYASTSLPLSPSSQEFDQYATQPPAGSGYSPASSGVADYQAPQGGYQTPPASGYAAAPTSQYALGGGDYDIQNQTQRSLPALPAYASPTAPYANNAAPQVGVNTSPYQDPPLPNQSNGYGAGLAQDPYGNMTPPAYPGAASTSPAMGAPSYSQGSYANSASGGSAEMVASVPESAAVARHLPE